MSTLTIKTDNKARLRYVTKIKDKLVKNGRDKELVSGAMPVSSWIGLLGMKHFIFISQIIIPLLLIFNNNTCFS
jgi:tetrahydromethanopterin S-methyltransferase subunit F